MFPSYPAQAPAHHEVDALILTPSGLHVPELKHCAPFFTAFIRGNGRY
ncbi:hypothetical protein [Micromonospora aurantiaca (nom. illeg.)]